jgi:hypothetical protein
MTAGCGYIVGIPGSDGKSSWGAGGEGVAVGKCAVVAAAISPGKRNNGGKRHWGSPAWHETGAAVTASLARATSSAR